MKKFLLSGLVIMLLAGCGGQAKQETVEQTSVQEETAKVLVYYFHGKQRCKSCVAIQQIAQEAVKESFAGNEDVKFVEIDFSDKSNEALAEKYEVAWSSLIVVSGEKFVNMTDEAFTKALSDAAGLKSSLTKTVNDYLSL
jgi:thiol-disulfide isomerase/thioredoxin